MLHVSRQAFYKYLQRKDRPWKYQKLADAMRDILKEDESWIPATHNYVD